MRSAQPPPTRCNAYSRRNLGPCTAWSIRGKDKCRMHGGTTPIKTHGLASKYGAPPALAARIVELERNPKLLQHTHIAAWMYAILEDLAAKLKNDAVDESLLPVLQQLLKAADSFHRLAADARFVDLIAARTLMSHGFERVLRFVPEERRAAAIDAMREVAGVTSAGDGPTPASLH
jgi:hypothetical protein